MTGKSSDQLPVPVVFWYEAKGAMSRFPSDSSVTACGPQGCTCGGSCSGGHAPTDPNGEIICGPLEPIADRVVAKYKKALEGEL